MVGKDAMCFRTHSIDDSSVLFTGILDGGFVESPGGSYHFKAVFIILLLIQSVFIKVVLHTRLLDPSTMI